MLEQMNAYCPHCARPQRAQGPGQCDRCGRRFDAAHRASIADILAAPRQPCQACCRSILTFTTVCDRCLVIQDPTAPHPRPLPPLHQGCLDNRTYENNYLYIVLPEGAPQPAVEDVIAALEAADLNISDAEPAPRHRGHRPLWEWVFSAQDPERPFQRWESGPRGVAPRAGERVHVWLEETGLPADMGLLTGDLLPEIGAYIHASSHTIGLHCDTTDDPSWNTRLMMRLIRCICPAHDPIVVERSTGRVLPDVWREAAELKPPPLEDCYTIREQSREGKVWLHTRGLPRWGTFELEVLGVDIAQAAEARQLLQAVAEMLVPMGQLPPPGRPLYFPNGAGFAWLPIEHLTQQLPPGLPGTMRSERRVLKHATAAVISPYFQPTLFAALAAAPPPPSAQARPSTHTLSASAVEASAATGASPLTPIDTSGPSPLIAAILSLLIPGAGQLLLGQQRKGLLVFLTALFTCAGLGLIPLLSAIDAGILAARRRERERALGEWEFFWTAGG